MSTVLADTSYYFALLILNDRKHHDAVQLTRRFRGQAVTTYWVLLELANYRSAVQNRLTFANAPEAVRGAPDHAIVPCSKADFDAGLQLYLDRQDKSWSLVDCISFSIMSQRKIVDAWTTDHHFVQAGFQSPLV